MKRHALGFLEGALGQTEGIGGLASAARTLYKSRIPGVDCFGAGSIKSAQSVGWSRGVRRVHFCQ